jgi:hypothetical protein
MLEARPDGVDGVVDRGVDDELAVTASSSSTPAPVAAWLDDAAADRWRIGHRRPTYAVRVLG